MSATDGFFLVAYQERADGARLPRRECTRYGVPQDRQAETVESKRHRALDRVGSAVADLADPGGLLAVKIATSIDHLAVYRVTMSTVALSRSVVTNAKS
jgi:hypothetical protein